MNSKGEIWFGTGASNLFYFKLQEIIDRRPIGVWHKVIEVEYRGGCKKILFDSKDNLWAAMRGYGLCNVTKNNSSWNLEFIPCKKKEILTYFYDIFLTHDQNIWFGGGSEKFAFSSSNSVQETFEAPFYISSLGEYDDQNILVGTYYDGLYSFNPKNKQWSQISLSAEHPNPYIECIKHTVDGAYWLGTREGAYRVTKTSWESFPTIPGGAKPRKRTLSRSDNGDIFVVDDNETLFQHKNNQWNKIVELPIDDSLLIYDTKDAHSLICRGDSLFYGYNQFFNDKQGSEGKCMKITLGNEINIVDIPLPDDFSIWCENATIFVSRSGQLWVMYEHGVASWDGERWHKQIPYEERGKKNVYCIFEPVADVFWILGRAWIDILDGNKCSMLPLPSSYTDYTDEWSRLFDAAEHNGAYWFASDLHGLLKFDGERWTHFHHKDGLPSEGIMSLCSGSDGALWVGSMRTKISSFKDGRWVAYGVDDGVPNAQVLTILEDGDGSIWLDLEHNGIAYYRPTGDAPIVWIDLGTENMLPNERGVFSFDGRDQWNVTRLEDLVYSWRVVEREIDKTVFDWSPYSKKRSITTPRLNPGDYRFEVRSQDKDRNTSKVPAAFDFTVQPYFWMTLYFQIPVGLSLLIALLSLLIWHRKHKALQSSEFKYRNLVEKDSLTLLVNWDRSGKIVYCNECTEKLFDSSASIIIGSKVEKWLANCTHASITDFYLTVDKAFENPDIPQECRLCNKFGEKEIWISWFFRAVSSENNTTGEIHAVGVDITRQVRTEKALMMEKMSFREFCDSVQIGILQLDLEGEVLYMNPAMQNISGNLDQAENYGISWSHSDDFRNFIKHIIESRKTISQLMGGMRLDNEEQFFVYLSGMLKDGRIELMALDFTEQKLLEQRLSNASSREQERLGQELHDGLGQQLTAIHYLGSLLERKSQNIEDELLELVQKINANISICIKQTRSLAKSMYPSSLEQSGLRIAVEELIQSFGNTYNTEIELHWNHDLTAIDTTHFIPLYRIIREACFNSLKHAKASLIKISSQTRGHGICILISDNGIGLSETVLDRKSNGMGMSIMEYHARMIGGELSISNRDAGGTVVSCIIP